MVPSPSHSTSSKEMDVTVPDIQELLPHVKHADVFVLIPVPCRNRSRCGGPNPEKCRGRCRPWLARSPRDMRISVAACSARRWRRGIQGRSLPCRCHSERCDLNTYLPLSGMLKKSASGVLTSIRGSTYRSVRLASSLVAALLDSLLSILK